MCWNSVWAGSTLRGGLSRGGFGDIVDGAGGVVGGVIAGEIWGFGCSVTLGVTLCVVGGGTEISFSRSSPGLSPAFGSDLAISSIDGRVGAFFFRVGVACSAISLLDLMDYNIYKPY